MFAVVDLNGCPEEQVLNGSQPDMDDAIPCDNLDDEPAQMIEELHSGIDNPAEEANLLLLFWSLKCKYVLLNFFSFETACFKSLCMCVKCLSKFFCIM